MNSVQVDAETTSAALPLPLSEPVNLRALAGFAIDGGTMQPGLAIRTDDLSYVTEDVANDLVENGLTSVIDLRSALEVSVTGRGPLAQKPVSYHHIPLMVDVAKATQGQGTTDFSHEAMGRAYVAMAQDAAPQLVMALNIIAYSPGTTAFHCTAGRDRTGVLAAMLLSILGASDQEIIDDYSLTGHNMLAILDRTQVVMAAMMKAFGFEGKTSQANKLAEGDMSVSMKFMLDTLRERHGDVLATLRVAGLSDDTVARLRQRALGA